MKRLFVIGLLLVMAAAAFGDTPWRDTHCRFAWGADAGASIDMTGDDMSSVDVSAAFGVSRGWIRFAGLGVQADFMVGNSCRSYPVFFNFRTNFRNAPSLLFWDLKAGMSLNYLESNYRQTGLYLSSGLGIVLASGKQFSSHILIGYNFRERRPQEGNEQTYDFKNLHCAYVKIGVAF